jgi:hypothetical protein
MSNALPEGFKVRTRKEWEDLQNSEDNTQRGLVNSALRALGVAPATYMKMPASDRIDYIMQRQQEAGHGATEAAEKPATKSKVGEPKVAAASKGEARGASAAAASPAGDAALKKQLTDLQAQLVELGNIVIEQGRFIREAHFILRVLSLADADLSTNLDDVSIRGEYAGKLGGFEGNG